MQGVSLQTNLYIINLSYILLSSLRLEIGLELIYRCFVLPCFWMHVTLASFKRGRENMSCRCIESWKYFMRVKCCLDGELFEDCLSNSTLSLVIFLIQLTMVQTYSLVMADVCVYSLFVSA